MSNPSKFHAYSGFFLDLHDNPKNAQTHFMFVLVQWAPDIREFHDLRVQAQPMSQLTPLFESFGHGESMRTEVEQAQREGQVLIQYVTINSVATSAAWSLSGPWKRRKSLKLERKLEEKCLAAGPFVVDLFYKSMLDKGLTWTEAQELLDSRGINKLAIHK
ncbi:hypothetical protein FIBSPDRAFT_970413 [Athelia psychrophila]|uniref:Uncharacterized protein n=1 Tax=Athelia psychrophila TaxID=1759441 RepID=A0A167SQ47_9AGAM|nr:hypothetical protein FIBSPDRAFT_970413 [Fibularhizoctonia sp. CBS 109695]